MRKKVLCPYNSGYRKNHRKCSVRKGALRNFAKFTGKHLFQGLSLGLQLYEKRNYGTDVSCEFCEISKNF